jgi:hypothetical protein
MDDHCIWFSSSVAEIGVDFQILSLLDLDAAGGSLTANLEVNSTTTSIDVSFEILEDQVFELTESFAASVFGAGSGLGSPNLNVMITDNEGTCRDHTYFRAFKSGYF